MIRFIKLTDSKDGRPVYVNVESVSIVQEYADITGSETLVGTTGDGAFVKESPETVLELIAKVEQLNERCF